MSPLILKDVGCTPSKRACQLPYCMCIVLILPLYCIDIVCILPPYCMYIVLLLLLYCCYITLILPLQCTYIGHILPLYCMYIEYGLSMSLQFRPYFIQKEDEDENETTCLSKTGNQMHNNCIVRHCKKLFLKIMYTKRKV